MAGCCSEQESRCIHPTRFQRRRYTAFATASVFRIHDPTFGARELDHGLARSRKPLAEARRRDLQDLGRLRAVELENLADNVSQSMIAVEASQHSERTADLDLFDEQLVLDGRTLRQTLIQFPAEALEVVRLTLQPALSKVEKGVRGQTIYPGWERTLVAI